jgi:hypothetical protein
MVNEQPPATSSGRTICACLRLIDQESNGNVQVVWTNICGCCRRLIIEQQHVTPSGWAIVVVGAD